MPVQEELHFLPSTLFHPRGNVDGGVAQMVERSLSMREVKGSIPFSSNNLLPFQFFWNIFWTLKT